MPSLLADPGICGNEVDALRRYNKKSDQAHCSDRGWRALLASVAGTYDTHVTPSIDVAIAALVLEGRRIEA